MNKLEEIMLEKSVKSAVEPLSEYISSNNIGIVILPERGARVFKGFIGELLEGNGRVLSLSPKIINPNTGASKKERPSAEVIDKCLKKFNQCLINAIEEFPEKNILILDDTISTGKSVEAVKQYIDERILTIKKDIFTAGIEKSVRGFINKNNAEVTTFSNYYSIGISLNILNGDFAKYLQREEIFKRKWFCELNDGKKDDYVYLFKFFINFIVSFNY